MKDLIPVWIAAGGAVVAAIIAAVTAALLAPLFQHGIWKKQKLREQRLDIARQFQSSTRHLPSLLAPKSPADISEEEWANRAGQVMDLKSTLACVRVLFDSPEIREWCDKFQIHSFDGDYRGGHYTAVERSEDWEKTLVAREELVARLFAEALDRKVDKHWFLANRPTN